MLKPYPLNILNPIQYGLFLKHYGMWGGDWDIMAPLVTLLFLKVEGQNLVQGVF